jgi:diaminopimelate epimerase
MILTGRRFYKMSGSGNDFVMIDARTEGRGDLEQPQAIKRVCARATGVGADGIVFLERSAVADVRLTYLNADGSPADFCGNATLCTTRLAVELGLGSPTGLAIETDAGIVQARVDAGGPEIDLQPVRDVQPDARGIAVAAGERRIGFALVGVPHLVIRCDDVARVDVRGRGRPLRSHTSLPHGANVNFVSPGDDGRWRYRTYERGVEDETLACGSGAVATAILLVLWGESSHSVELETRSGKLLRVRLSADHAGRVWSPSLSGEGRVVFEGSLAEV